MLQENNIKIDPFSVRVVKNICKDLQVIKFIQDAVKKPIWYLPAESAIQDF
jgi:hypothetical protein